MSATKSPGTYQQQRLRQAAILRDERAQDAISSFPRTALPMTRQEMCNRIGIVQGTSYEPQWRNIFSWLRRGGYIE